MFPSWFSRYAILLPSGDHRGIVLSHRFSTAHRTRRVSRSMMPMSRWSWRFETNASSSPSGDQGSGGPGSPPIEHSEFGNATSFSIRPVRSASPTRSEEHTSELQSRGHLVCRLLLEKKNKQLF